LIAHNSIKNHHTVICKTDSETLFYQTNTNFVKYRNFLNIEILELKTTEFNERPDITKKLFAHCFATDRSQGLQRGESGRDLLN